MRANELLTTSGGGTNRPLAATGSNGTSVSIFFKALERAEQESAWRRRLALPAPPTDVRPMISTAARPGLDQLKLLFDYSKFQIGLYTIVASLFTIAIALQPTVFRIHTGLLGVAIVFVCLAGMAAGIVANRCTQSTSWHELWAAKIGPLGLKCLEGEYWTYLQHAFFGIALAMALSSVFFVDGAPMGFFRRLVSCWSHWPPTCPPH